MPSNIRRLRAGTVFKLLWTGNTAFLAPLYLLKGVAGLFGLDVLRSEGSYVHGLEALTTAAGFLIAGPLVFASFAFVPTFTGLWLYSRWRPLVIEFFESKP